MNANKEKLIEYLNDVYQLEIQKRIARNVLIKIKRDIQDQKSGIQAKYQYNNVQNDVIPNMIFIPVLCLCCLIFLLPFNRYCESRVSGIQQKAEEYSAKTNIDPSRYDGISTLPHSSPEETNAFLLNGTLKKLEKEKLLYTICKISEYVFIVLLLWTSVRMVSEYKKKQKEKTKARQIMKSLLKKTDNKLNFLNKNFDAMEESEEKIEKTLQSLYFLDKIRPKYRYLEACGTFYEYLKFGRTQMLESTSDLIGAYSLFEEELFRGEITDKLDHVSENQKTLMQGKKNIKTGMDTILSGIDEICSEVCSLNQGIEKSILSKEVSNFYNSVNHYKERISQKILENYY